MVSAKKNKKRKKSDVIDLDEDQPEREMDHAEGTDRATSERVKVVNNLDTWTSRY